MKTFGITGGIGMGKSAAATILCHHGVPVIDADDIAKQVVERGQPALSEIKTSFGGDVFNSDGYLNRQKLASLVFADVAARAKLESILHPLITRRWETQLAEWRDQRKTLAVVVIPLLFETKAETTFDSVICMACTERTQQTRLAARGWSPDEVSRRIAAQMSVAEKMSRSDYVVWTEGEVAMTASQLDRIFVH